MALAEQKSDIDVVWKTTSVRTLTFGINKLLTGDLVKDEQSPNMSNVEFNQRRVQIVTGYVNKGAALAGNPRVVHRFDRINGTIEVLLFTNTAVYKWHAASSAWQVVGAGVSTTAADGEPAGETLIYVASTTGFVTTRLAGITLDNASQHISVISALDTNTDYGAITASAGTTTDYGLITASADVTTDYGLVTGSIANMTIADAIPSGRTVASGAAVVQGANFVGVDATPVDVLTLASSDQVIFTNGVDNVKKYGGTTLVDVSNLPSSGNTQCRTLAVFHDHLLLGNTTEGGTRYPQRVRRSDTGDITNWTTGNSGTNDLYDSEDLIQRIRLLGPYAITYRRHSISRISWVGSADLLFDIETVIKGTGLLAPAAVIEREDHHLFLAEDNIYKYDGAISIEPVGDEIKGHIFGQTGSINPDKAGTSLAFYTPSTKESWFIYPTGTNTLPNEAARYREDTKAWSIRAFAIDITGYGYFTSTAAVAWNGLVGSWEDQNWTWDSQRGQVGFVKLLLCDATNDKVVEYDFLSPQDAGAAISYSIETKDFFDPAHLIRFDQLTCLLKGTNIVVAYSTNEGDTWTTLDTVSPGAAFTRQRVWGLVQAVVERIRFRFSGSGGGFVLGWFSFKYRQESEY